jgi:hypothetical protein
VFNHHAICRDDADDRHQAHEVTRDV